MGTVYLAERADRVFSQHAALKIMRRFSGAGRLRRFEQERQILAQLEHPHIARLIDGGTTGSGLPYLVMERVNCIPLPE